VGFPGETESDFQATLDYLRRAGYDHAFSFAYSPREGTRAARWPETVDRLEKRRRLETVIELQEKISLERSRHWCGRSVEVLVEGSAKRGQGWLSGKSPEFKTTVFPSSRHAVGDLVRVAVRDATAHTLIGDAVDEQRPEAHADA
jgi:tRNA-2-methylthio-N6-dimethylallyladenosine synthase